jgi:ElaB/YqjD/DUF883 family membrane-anchored ribosome-binding protein
MTTQSTYPEIKPSSAHNRTVGETLEVAGSELKAKAESMLETGKTRAGELLQRGRERAVELKGGFEEGIRAKPIQSVLIAAGVGAIVGLLVGRRSS